MQEDHTTQTQPNFLKWLAAPVFEQDEEKTRVAHLLNVLLLGSMLAGFTIGVVNILLTGQIPSGILGLLLAAISVISWSLLRRNLVTSATWIYLIVIWMLGVWSVWTEGATKSTELANFVLFIVIAGMLLGKAGGTILTLLSIGTVWGLLYAESHFPVPMSSDPALSRVIWMTLLYGVTGVLVRNFVNMVHQALEHSRQSERNAVEMARQLEERTDRLEQWAGRLEAVAKVSRTAISIHNPDELLDQIVHLLSKLFDFYHVGVFLLDDSGEYAVLRAANSEGGRQMLAQGHKLQVGKQGIVGYVIAYDEPRVALDVGADAVHFKNPLLPETRSEMALPLRVGERVIGALDVQSRQENAFNDDDVMVLQMMADYLANTIENANLLHMTHQTAQNLSAAATEILAATTQQASGASEQSAAVAQTTTTVDELKTIATQSVERAQEVAGASQRTVEVSRAGKQAVEETIASMAHIRNRVEGIAENILALSEQTQQVDEIISTVNEIASQSNILALNASVEAARAGEYGKGFAVVAQEVRSLAEQSRQATAQVRAILSDIQRATNATVMATEEGTKQVEEGMRLARRSGEAIEALAQEIAENAQAAVQLVAGGRQQASGVEQVALAMQNINQATTQSLASTRQAEQAARELSDLAHRLSAITTRYQA